MVQAIVKTYESLNLEEQTAYAAREAAWQAGENERAWQSIRTERDRYLAATDWAALPDSPAYSQALLAYRQALRDLPQQFGSPEESVWPVNPLEG